MLHCACLHACLISLFRVPILKPNFWKLVSLIYASRIPVCSLSFCKGWSLTLNETLKLMKEVLQISRLGLHLLARPALHLLGRSKAVWLHGLMLHALALQTYSMHVIWSVSVSEPFFPKISWASESQKSKQKSAAVRTGEESSALQMSDWAERVNTRGKWARDTAS